jgi:alpha/beta superfamily hydrolase
MSVRKLLTVILLSFSYGLHASLIPGESLFLDPQVLFFSQSPAENYVIRNVHDEKRYYLILTDLESMKSVPLFYLDKQADARITQVRWISDMLVYVRYNIAPNDSRHAFVYLEIRDGELPKTTIKPIRAYGYIIDPLPEDPEKMLFADLSRTHLNDKRLYVATIDEIIDAKFTKAKRFARPIKDAVAYYAGAHGDELLAKVSRNEMDEIWRLNKTTGRWSRIYVLDGEEHTFEPAGFLDSGTLAVLTNRDADLVSLRKFHIDTQQIGEVIYQHSSYDLIAAEVSSKDGWVESVSYVDHGQVVTEYFSFSDQVLSGLLSEVWPDKHIAMVAGRGTRWQIVSVFGSNEPGSHFVLDLKTLTAKPLSSDYPELVGHKLAVAEVLKVPVEDDAYVEALLTRPIARNNGVLIVYPHGGPIGVRDLARYDPVVQYLANRGYSVLQVNFRGSSGFGEDFRRAGVGQFGQLIEQDISAAVSYVQKRHVFQKMCAMGASYGGYSAVMLAVQNPNDYDCVISKYGIYDLPLLYSYKNYYRHDKVRQAIARVVGEDHEALKKNSLLHRADEIKAPVLVIAGSHLIRFAAGADDGVRSRS